MKRETIKLPKKSNQEIERDTTHEFRIVDPSAPIGYRILYGSKEDCIALSKEIDRLHIKIDAI